MYVPKYAQISGSEPCFYSLGVKLNKCYILYLDLVHQYLILFRIFFLLRFVDTTMKSNMPPFRRDCVLRTYRSIQYLLFTHSNRSIESCKQNKGWKKEGGGKKREKEEHNIRLALNCRSVTFVIRLQPCVFFPIHSYESYQEAEGY